MLNQEKPKAGGFWTSIMCSNYEPIIDRFSRLFFEDSELSIRKNKHFSAKQFQQLEQNVLSDRGHKESLDKLKEFLDMLTLAKTNIAVYGKTHTGMTTYLLSMSSMANLPPAPKDPPSLQEVIKHTMRTCPPKLVPLPHPGGCWEVGSVVSDDEKTFVCESADELRVSNTKLEKSAKEERDVARALRDVVRRYFASNDYH